MPLSLFLLSVVGFIGAFCGEASCNIGDELGTFTTTGRALKNSAMRHPWQIIYYKRVHFSTWAV